MKASTRLFLGLICLSVVMSLLAAALPAAYVGRAVASGSAAPPVQAASLASPGNDAEGVVLPEGASSDWWSMAQESIRQSEYDICWQEQTCLPEGAAAYQAPNRAQNLRTYFTPSGICVVPRTDGGLVWELGLSLVGYGYRGDIQSISDADLSTDGNRIEYLRGAISEWYINSQSGLKQGFSIDSPPTGSSSDASADMELVLQMAVSGNLSPYLCDKGQAIEFTTLGGVRLLRYSELQVTDSTGVALPSHLSLSAPTMSIIVDASSAVYPIQIDPLTTSPSWRGESNQSNAQYGFSAGTAGDVNGDGYDDVVVGTPYFDVGEVIDAGAASVYLGSATGLNPTPVWEGKHWQKDAHFGYSVGTAGDVNGDGFDDIIVGAPGFDDGVDDIGQACVYLGSATGIVPGPFSEMKFPWKDAHLGYSVGTAGDVNGDGYDDVIIGVPYLCSGQDYEGGALVYHGSSNELTVAWCRVGGQAKMHFGYSVGTAGDVNGDGYDDVIVGAPDRDNNGDDAGRAYVYQGSASGLGDFSWFADGDEGHSYFGCSVGTAGDVNGDGYDDIIVGQYGRDNGGWVLPLVVPMVNQGAAYVYYGSANGIVAEYAWSVKAQQHMELFGWSVGTAGDVDGDGYDDVIVGARSFSHGEGDEGAAYLYHGSASGLPDYHAWMAEGNQDDADFGYSAGTAGDVNGDGSDDVIVGAPRYNNGSADEGMAFVYLTSNWDTVPPNKPILVLPANGAVVNRSTPTLDWTDVTDPSGVGYWIVVDDNADFSSPLFNYPLTSSEYTLLPGEAPVNGTYYWKVVAFDGSGNLSAWTSPRSFTVDDTAPPQMPALLSPANGAVVNRSTPTLDWTDVADLSGVGYWILLDDNADFSAPLFNYPLASSEYTLLPGEAPANGTYYWKVVAFDGLGNLSAWTSPWSFTVDDNIAPDMPVLVSPGNGATIETRAPTLDWTDVTDVSGVGYWILLDDNADFSSPLFNYPLASSEYTLLPSEALSDGTYYWKVVAFDGLANLSAWTSPWSFTVDIVPTDTPVLVSPANGAVVNRSTPLLDWADVTDPSGVAYWILVDDNADFSSPLFNHPLTSSEYIVAPGELPANGTYYWKVVAFDGFGNLSAWTSPWSLTVDDTVPPDMPVLVSPANGAVVNTSTPTLDWTDVTDLSGVGYWILLDDNADFSSPLFDHPLTPSEYTLTVGEALADGRYYWKVVAFDALANLSAWTSPRSLTVDTVAPPVPTIVSPANGALINDSTPTLDWTDVTDPSGAYYWYQIDDSSDFSSLIVGGYVNPSDYAVASALTDGVYYWRVCSADLASNVSAWTSPRSFTVDTVAPPMPTLVSPANGALTNDSTPTLDWTDVTDPSGAYYWYQIDDSSDFSSLIVSGYVNPSDYTVASALTDGVYYWRVCSADLASNVSAWTGSRSFTVDTVAPPMPTLVSPANGALTNDSTPTLDWTDVTDPSGAYYWYQIDDSSDFSSLIVGGYVNPSDYTVASALTDGVYYWRVCSADLASNVSAWTSPRSFTVDTVAPPMATIVSPANGALTSDSTPTLDWTDVTDPSGAYYWYQVDDTSDFSSLIVGGYVNPSDYTVASALTDGVYYWRVCSADLASNVSAWTSPRSFTVYTALPAVTGCVPTQGGKVETGGGGLVAECPAGAVPTTATVIIKQVEPGGQPTPKGFTAGSTCFIIEANDDEGNAIVTLSEPVAITVRYSDEDVAAAGGDPNRLVLAYYDEAAAEWKPVDTMVNTTDKTLSTNTLHFSTWTVLAKNPGGGLAAWVWIVIGIAVAAGVGAIVFFVRRTLMRKA